ncbi:MAG: phosphatidylglycerol lysyltransferase domain-containing protein [Desulfuromonadales bacterium]|nr:phosphatidylglycerol lysyltransferase domain-containing protein [Desulfuromonadales bacterium]
MVEIPPYPQSRPLVLADKERFDLLFRQLQPRISELTFAGLYLFRHAHTYRLTMVNDALVILGRSYGAAPFFFPPLSGDIAAALDRLFADQLPLYGADESFVASYLTGRPCEVTDDRANADYLYRREDLAELRGQRYHKKKNRLNVFIKHYQYVVASYGPEYRDGCRELLAAWREERMREGENLSLEREAQATAEALEYAGELGLAGLVVLVGGEVKGFVLGERLNQETSVCHFEKADPQTEGLSQFLDREFNRLLFTDCTYVNREQDLGDEGLRMAKSTYHPIELITKYRATPLLPK